uniref:Uncharacterized protein n=1 Tax=Avena sativa TaxID=4498 RepID=A0ACD5ZGG0_AVESA
MATPSSCHQLLLPVTLLVVILATAAAQSFPYEEPQLMARPGCVDRCGNMSIPFPFGIGSGCFRDGFEISCDRSFDPPRVFLAGKGTTEERGFVNDTDIPAYRRFSRLELASISLLWRQARVYAPISYFYGTRTAGDTTTTTGLLLLTKQFFHLASTPFAVSTKNGIIGVGWSTQPTVSYDPEQPAFFSCQTTWATQKDPPYDTTNGLCVRELPYALGPTQYIELAVLYQGLQSAYALLVESYNPMYNFYMTDMYSNQTLLRKFPRGVAIKLDFAAGNTSCPAEGQPLPPDYACVSANSSCVSATRTPGYLCECSEG